MQIVRGDEAQAHDGWRPDQASAAVVTAASSRAPSGVGSIGSREIIQASSVGCHAPDAGSNVSA